MSQAIFKAGCWTCLKAQHDPNEKYVCPYAQQHLKDFEQWEQQQNNYF